MPKPPTKVTLYGLAVPVWPAAKTAAISNIVLMVTTIASLVLGEMFPAGIGLCVTGSLWAMHWATRIETRFAHQQQLLERGAPNWRRPR